MTEFTFEMTCFCTDKNKIVNEIKDYVYYYHGDVKYTEFGVITKYLTFYISIDTKYENAIIDMYNQIKNIF